MKPRDLRLVPVCGATWCAALICIFRPDLAAPVAAVCLGGAIVVLAAITVMATRAREGGAPIRGGLLAVMLAAAAAVAVVALLAAPGRDAASEHGGRVVEVTAEVASSASVGQDGRLWFDAQTRTIGAAGRGDAISVPVRIGIDPAAGFDLGATIDVSGQVVETGEGERSALVVFATDARVTHPASGVFAAAAGIRHAFIERAVRLPVPGAGLLPGLAVGDTRAVSATLDDDMRASGLSHLTAVSGANCAIVVAAVFGVVALCGGSRGLRVALAGLALAGFVVLVTPEPSVVRASVMAGVAMLTVLLGRPAAGAGVLALSAVGILLVDPWLAASPGFALSVAASGALILLGPPLARGLERWMPRPLAVAVSVPLAAQLACGPVIALFAEQQSLVGIIANLVAAPAAPIATVVGLLACLASPVPPLADLLAASAWLPAAWIAVTANVSADLPGAQVPVTPGIGGAVLVAVLSATVAVVVRGRGQGTPSASTRSALAQTWTYRVCAMVLVVALALGAGHLVTTGPLAAMSAPSGWSIAACDVGQGDALLVRSEGEVALIDTGPESGPLDECLRSLGIDRIDLLVLTHFDLDHVGGVDAVRGRVGAVLHGPVVEAEEQRILDGLGAGGATVTEATAGMRGTLGASTWRVLWPQRESLVFPSGNDASVVIEVSGGGVPRSLYLGDLSAEAQRMLQRTARIAGPYDVVKVAHHGSADQDPGLYEASRPAVALFSAGVGNDYGHPRKETLDLLVAVGARTLRTDRQGRILLGLQGDAIAVWTETDVGAPQ